MPGHQASSPRMTRKTSLFKLYRESNTAHKTQAQATGRQTTVSSKPVQTNPANHHATDSTLARRHTFSSFNTGWTAASEAHSGATSNVPGFNRRHTFSHFEASHKRITEYQDIKRLPGTGASDTSRSVVMKILVRKQSTKVSIVRV